VRQSQPSSDAHRDDALIRQRKHVLIGIVIADIQSTDVFNWCINSNIADPLWRLPEGMAFTTALPNTSLAQAPTSTRYERSPHAQPAVSKPADNET
jgi:hypothetical protein